MEKSAQAFRTISEVAKALDVPAHVLRFWESRFTQIKPVKRGGGRRYYRPEDVDLIKGIRNLLYVEGLTIKGAQKVLRDRGVRHVIAVGQGKDAQIAEADALWDEPGAGDMAANAPSPSPAPVAAPKREAVPKPVEKRPAPKPIPQTDPRQSSLFASDDEDDAPIVEPMVEAPDFEPPSFRAQAAASEPAHAPTQTPQDHNPAPPEAQTSATSEDDGLDQDALRDVFSKLKALRASMEPE